MNNPQNNPYREIQAGIQSLPASFIRELLFQEVKHANPNNPIQSQSRNNMLRGLHTLESDAKKINPRLVQTINHIRQLIEALPQEDNHLNSVTLIHHGTAPYQSQAVPEDFDETVHISANSPQQAQNFTSDYQFHILRELGRGGMGVVYEAVGRNGTRVALKQIHETDPEKYQSFAREAEAASRVQHPNVVKVLGIIQHQSLPTMVCEYVEGLDGDDFMTAEIFSDLFTETGKAKFSPLAALLILEQMNMALLAAHQIDIIHQDIKPANFIFQCGPIIERLQKIKEQKGSLSHSDIENTFTDFRNTAWIKLADFGMAVLRQRVTKFDIGNGGQTYSVKTVPSDRLGGTTMYMAPEQAELDGETSRVSGRTDVFALGLILYQLLTGQPASTARFYGEGIKEEAFSSLLVAISSIMRSESQHAVNTTTDPHLSSLGIHDIGLQELLMGMLEREKDKRFRSLRVAHEIHGRINLTLQQGKRDQHEQQQARNTTSHLKLMILGILSILACTGAIYSYLTHSQKDPVISK